MNLFKNLLVELLVISLSTYSCLGCAPATSPCAFSSTIPRSGIQGLNADCSGTALTNPATDCAIRETCEIPNGETFTVSADVCDTGALTDRPIVLDGTENTVTQAVEFTCSGDGLLTASSGGTQLDADVEQADCLSRLSTSNCAFTLNEIDQQLLVGNDVVCDNANNCWVPDGAQFTIAANVCARNGFNRPLRLNGADNPATLGNANVATTYECRSTALQATSTDGSFTEVADVASIECGNQCVLDTTGLTAGVTSFGTCDTTAAVTAQCIVLVDDTSGALVVDDSVCALGDRVVFGTSAGGTGAHAPSDGGTIDNINVDGDMLTLTCIGDGMVQAVYDEDAGNAAADPNGDGTYTDVYSISCFN